MSGREEAEKVSTSPSINAKSTTESKALDLLQQHANQYRSKSPVVRLHLLSLWYIWGGVENISFKKCTIWHQALNA